MSFLQSARPLVDRLPEEMGRARHEATWLVGTGNMAGGQVGGQ